MKNKHGEFISEGSVVKDIYDRVWVVETITSNINRPAKIKCRNSCSFCFWTIDDVTPIMYASD